MVQSSIPFNKPFIVGRELEYISQAVASGQLAGNGLFTKKCQKFIEELYGVPKVLLTHSCTSALEMSALLCEISSGDEVILPSYTYVSTANAFLLRGATLKFVDIRPDTLNIDESLIEKAITKNTKVLCPVHYAGVSCEMDTILDLAQHHGIRIVEDAAHGMDSTYRDRFLGTLGDLAAFSFHETKNLISGEGGALLINDPAFIKRAEVIWEKGTNRIQFFRGEVDKYTWMDIGSSYLPSELVAAFLYAQFEHGEKITKHRLASWECYRKALSPLQDSKFIRLPIIPEHCRHNAHMFYILLKNEEARNNLISHFRKCGIHAVFHYIPLHLSPMGLRMGYQPGQLPVTEDISKRIIRLPLFFELNEEQQNYIIEKVFEYFQ